MREPRSPAGFGANLVRPGLDAMTDLATAVALLLVVEGMLWALSPRTMKRAAAIALAAADEQLRTFGLVAAALGVVLVWLLRG